ncbi:hypothetical protein [uncultured Roseovarius sp.]|uniref:hypothetical protein n=1 Tax=uncultured Roseovarius sp. TaxID=293344 RepID=UPI0025EA3120|nr:hypothetical protein [uncultured Roseovarius sp.]
MLVAVCLVLFAPGSAEAHGRNHGVVVTSSVVDADMHVASEGAVPDCCHVDGSCTSFAMVAVPMSPRVGMMRLVLVKPDGAMRRGSRQDTADPPPPRA